MKPTQIIKVFWLTTKATIFLFQTADTESEALARQTLEELSAKLGTPIKQPPHKVTIEYDCIIFTMIVIIYKSRCGLFAVTVRRCQHLTR